MTTCIKCGQPIPDGELFCESCGLNGEVPQPRPALRPVGRMQTPVKREPRPGKPQPAPAPEKKSRGGRAAAAVLALPRCWRCSVRCCWRAGPSAM